MSKRRVLSEMMGSGGASQVTEEPRWKVMAMKAKDLPGLAKAVERQDEEAVLLAAVRNIESWASILGTAGLGRKESAQTVMKAAKHLRVAAETARK